MTTVRSPIRRAALLLSLLLSACKTTEGGDTAQPDYASDADTNLKRGNDALESKNYVEAERYFEFVKSKYPFLEAAKEAELKLADTDYDRERFLEARDRYQSFIKLHPTHPRLDYAAFRAAMTHHRDIPSDLFILPPAEEKDQIEVRSSLSAMSDFVRQYPKSQYVEEAKQKIDDARKRLAQHELYVARFYQKRARWGAVVSRLKTLVRDYPGLGFDEEAYFGLYDAYGKLKDEANAKESLRAIVQKLPGTKASARAQALLGPSG